MSITQIRRDNVDWLFSLIERNDGRTVQFWMTKFAELTGTSRKTVAQYLKQLRMSKRIYYTVGDVVHAKMQA